MWYNAVKCGDVAQCHFPEVFEQQIGPLNDRDERFETMNKKLIRLLSVALAVVLAVSVSTPVKVSAVSPSTNEIKQQIQTTYKKAKAYYGWSSFHGFCGAWVNMQLHLLGVTKEVLGVDGKDAYDAFKGMKATSGGYSVKTYPAGMYTLQSALNEITKNGTRDVYNILVGFEKTYSVLGRRYGHAVVIHAIIDGKVYFAESYNVTLNGVYYKEGTPLVATIDEFVEYYAGTTSQFDGVVYFGVKTYANSCVRYSSYGEGSVAVAAEVWSQPCKDTVQSASSVVTEMAAGETVHITGLYQNTEGEYWYELDKGETGYIPAEAVQGISLRYDDVTLTGATAPTVLVQGKSFSPKGAIQTEHNSIYSIRARVYARQADQMEQVINISDKVDGKAYDLLRSKISSGLTFRSLEVGQYHYEVAAIVANYYVEGGQLMTGWDTVILWSSEFLVVDKKANVSTITFDTCGGSNELDQTVVLEGQTIGSLPVPQWGDRVFLGWFTEAEGGERITAEDVPQGNMTCYARWITQQELRSRWMEGGNCWYLYSDGISTMVCMEVEGSLYYFSSMEPLCQSWMMWTDAGAA